MTDNNDGYTMLNKLTVAKLAIEKGIPALESVSTRFLDLAERSDGNWAEVLKTELSARYQVIASGSEANVGKMLDNEGKAAEAAFSFLDKLFDKGFGIVEKALDLKAMEEAGRAPERAAHIASVEMETRLAERKLAIAEMEAQARMMEAKARLAREERELLEEQKEKAEREERSSKPRMNGQASHG